MKMQLLYSALYECDWNSNTEPKEGENAPGTFDYLFSVPSLFELSAAEVLKKDNREGGKETYKKKITPNIYEKLQQYAQIHHEVHMRRICSVLNPGSEPWVYAMGKFYAKCVYSLIFQNIYIHKISATSYSKKWFFTIPPDFYFYSEEEKKQFSCYQKKRLTALEAYTQKQAGEQPVEDVFPNVDDKLLKVNVDESKSIFTRIYVTPHSPFRVSLCVYTAPKTEDTDKSYQRTADLFLLNAANECIETDSEERYKHLDKMLYTYNFYSEALLKVIQNNFKGSFGLDPCDKPIEDLQAMVKEVFPEYLDASSSPPPLPRSLRIPHDPHVIPVLDYIPNRGIFTSVYPASARIQSFLPISLPFLTPVAFMKAHDWTSCRQTLELAHPNTSFAKPIKNGLLVNSAVMGPITRCHVTELRDFVIIGQLRVRVSAFGGVLALAHAFLDAGVFSIAHHIGAKVKKIVEESKEGKHEVHFTATEVFYTNKRNERHYTFCFRVDENSENEISVGPSYHSPKPVANKM